VHTRALREWIGYPARKRNRRKRKWDGLLATIDMCALWRPARLSSVPVRFSHSYWERSTLHAKIDCRVWKNSRDKEENAHTCISLFSSIEIESDCRSELDDREFHIFFFFLFPFLVFSLTDSFFRFASRKFLIDGFCAFKSYDTSLVNRIFFSNFTRISIFTRSGILHIDDVMLTW